MFAQRVELANPLLNLTHGLRPEPLDHFSSGFKNFPFLIDHLGVPTAYGKQIYRSTGSRFTLIEINAAALHLRQSSKTVEGENAMLTQSKCAACSSCPSFKAAEWQGIPADGLRMIEKYKKERVLRPGELVHSQGDPCEGIYCVRSGLIGERRVDCDGRSVLVRLYHAGLSLGYREVLSNSTCANSVEALRESRVCFLGRSVINELMDRYPVFCREFLQRSISDCRQMEDELVEAKTLGVRYRFLHLLLEFYRRFGVHDAFRGHELDIPLARQDLASLLGTAPETISRMIRQLEGDGLVHFHGHRVHFPDLELVSRQLHAVAA